MESKKIMWMHFFVFICKFNTQRKFEFNSICRAGEEWSVLDQSMMANNITVFGHGAAFPKNLNIALALSLTHRTFKIFLNRWRLTGCTARNDSRNEDSRWTPRATYYQSYLGESNPYLDELVQEVNELTSVLVSPAVICRLLKCYGFTRKKVRQNAMQRCCVLCGAFMA